VGFIVALTDIFVLSELSDNDFRRASASLEGIFRSANIRDIRYAMDGLASFAGGGGVGSVLPFGRAA
jgi:hypothetical protein